MSELHPDHIDTLYAAIHTPAGDPDLERVSEIIDSGPEATDLFLRVLGAKLDGISLRRGIIAANLALTTQFLDDDIRDGHPQS